MVVRARDIMTERVVTIRPDAPLSRAHALLSEYRFSALPVIDGRGRLVGMISAIDLLRQKAHPELAAATTVADLMNPDVLSMRPDANIAILTHRLRAYGDLRVMPIADRGQLHGVVTRSDLLRPRKKPGALARAISRFQTSRHDDDPLEAARRTSRRGPVDWSHEVTVREVMTPVPLVTVTSSTSTEEAVEILTTNRFTALPVVGDGGVLVGIVSEADLLRDPLDGRQTARSRTVGGAMTREVTTVSPATPISELLADVVDLGLRVVPVVEDKRLVGIVSRSDLL